MQRAILNCQTSKSSKLFILLKIFKYCNLQSNKTIHIEKEKIKDEHPTSVTQLIKHLPYLNWKEWIHELNKYKYGVHLMRTHAAGTFALNCAYLGIPCIGYKGLDTQMICHPDLTVELGDLNAARNIALKLRKDEEFYLYCSKLSKDMYNKHFSEEVFKQKFYNK